MSKAKERTKEAIEKAVKKGVETKARESKKKRAGYL